MYDKHLDTFLAVADSGSFLKASERLYLSPNALRKQVALLEEDLGVELFRRSHAGVELTPGGKYLYQEARKFIAESQSDIQRAKELNRGNEVEIKIGVSLMNPADLLLKRWAKVCKDYPNIQVSVVPFEDTHESFYLMAQRLGKGVDLIGVVYDHQPFIGQNDLTFLRKIPARLALSYNNPLASKDLLTHEDLRGCNILLPKRIEGSVEAKVRDMLSQDPEIRVVELPTFDYSTFKDVSRSNALLLSCDNWSNVNPFLKTIPVDWDVMFDYCLLHAVNPSPGVERFIQVLQRRF